MKADPLRLNKVFGANLRLVVPLFQRPYVWERDEQWEPLWEDIVAAYDRRSDDTPPHFLGAIVLEQRPAGLGRLDVREVIDGQQRLTTLQLVIAALRDTYHAHHIGTEFRRRLDTALHNDAGYAATPDERYRLWPTIHDRPPFRDVLDGKYRSGAVPRRAPQITAAYGYFREQIEFFLAPGSGDDEIAAMLDGLSEVLLEHLELVVIDLDEEDNAQVIFESLNARGTPLRAADLIKNALFRTLQSRRGAEVEALYATYWEPLESDYWREEISVGRMKRPRLDVFVGYFLAILLEREVLIHQLFPAARGYFSGEFDRALHFLQEISRYAAVFEGIDPNTPPTAILVTADEKNSLTNLKIADTATIQPTLLWLFANSEGSQREHAVALLESFLVRRTLCRLTPKNYNRLFLELLTQLALADRPADLVVEEFLAGQTSDSGLWPTDDQVELALRTLPVFRLLRRGRIHHLLLAFEAALTSDRTEPYRDYATLSVEHLLPQAWQHNWPLGDGDPEAEADRRDALLHTIGNLTLVTGKLNAALSNRAWWAKRTDILAHSALSLNRGLPETWDCAAIVDRSDALAHLAIQLWPRPGYAVTAEIADADQILVPDRDARTPASRARRRPAKRDAAGRSSRKRRDIAAHIVHAFRDLPVGGFLTVREIADIPSAEYPAGDPPSHGAINARLFPANNSPCTVPGIVGDSQGGRRGARKRE